MTTHNYRVAMLVHGHQSMGAGRQWPELFRVGCFIFAFLSPYGQDIIGEESAAILFLRGSLLMKLYVQSYM